mgnify:CR=1 FL=1
MIGGFARAGAWVVVDVEVGRDAPQGLQHALRFPHPGRVRFGPREEEGVLGQAVGLGGDPPGQGLPLQGGGVDQDGVHVLPLRKPQGLARAHRQHLDPDPRFPEEGL